MAKSDNNKESGAEKAPILTEDKGIEITPEKVAALQAKNSELERVNQEKDAKIAELDSLIFEQVRIINEGLEEKEKDMVLIAGLEGQIKEKDGIIEEQKSKTAQLNKSIADFGIIYSKEKEGSLPKEGETVVRFLLSPAGRFKLPYNVGQEVALHKEVAAEIVEAAYAEYVK